MAQQTIPANDRTISSHVGSTPSTGPFAVDFPFFSLDDVVVTRQADGAVTATQLVRGADYSLAGVATDDGSFSSGTVTLVLPVSNATIVRHGDTTVQRLSNFPLQGFFSRLALNAELNRLTVVDQEFDQRLTAELSGLETNALQVPADETALNTIAAPAASRAGKALGWDASGNLIHSTKTLSVIENPTLPGVSASTLGYTTARSWGCVLDGVTDDTVAFQAALNGGGEILIDGPMLLTSVTASLPFTRLRGTNGGKIIAAANSINPTLWVNASDFSMENMLLESLLSPNQGQFVWISGSNYKLKSVRLFGMSYNPQTATTPAGIGPLYAVYVGGRTTPYALYQNGYMDDVHVSGGNAGIVIQGAVRSKFNNISTFYCLCMGMNIGGGLTAYDIEVSNYLSVGCGCYGFTNAMLFGGASASEPVPMQNWLLSNMHVEKSGWMTYFAGYDSSDVGATKYGYDLTDNGMRNLRFQGSAMDCAAGGVEDKGGASTFYDAALLTSAATAAGGTVLTFAPVSGVYLKMAVVGTNIPADTYVTAVTGTTVTISRAVAVGGVALGATIQFLVDIQPPGHNDMLIDMTYVSHLDSGQQGVGLWQEDATIASGAWVKNHHIRCFAITEQAPTWRSLHQYRTWDVVASNGLAWICFGRFPDAATANSGSNAPPAGSSNIFLSANGTTASGNVVNVTSTTGAVVGMWVFAQNLPNGTTITAINPGVSLTLSNPVIAPGILTGKRLIVGTMWNDGNVMWFCMNADTSGAATLNTAVSSYGVKNATIDIDCIGVGRALAISTAYGGLNVTYENLKATVKARDAYYGITIGGTVGLGSLVNATFLNCDIEARSIAFQTASPGTNDFLISGGRFINYGAVSQQALRISSGTNTVRLDGGVVFKGQYAAYIDGGVNTIRCGAAVFEENGLGGYPVQLLGTSSGTIDWGNAIAISTVNGVGWFRSAGTMTTRGQLLRQDLSTAPLTTTVGNVGEYMILATPTALAAGYYCTAATFGPANITWTAFGGGLTFSTSADLRALVSDETGTGALVFANTPTLVTPVLGVAGATSVRVADGTAASPSLSFTSTPAMGFFLDSSGNPDLALAVGGKRALVLGTVGASNNRIRITSNNTPMITAVEGAGGNQALGLSGAGTGGVEFYAGTTGLTFGVVSTGATVANYVQMVGQTAGNGPQMQAIGSDTNIDLNLQTKGTGMVRHSGNSVFPNGTALLPSINFTGDTTSGFYRNVAGQVNIGVSGKEALRVSASGASNNYIQFVSNNTPTITAVEGSAGNINLQLSGAGQAGVDLMQAAGGSYVARFTALASPSNYVEFRNAALTAAPQISTLGGDTDIDLSLNAKGAGKLKMMNANFFAANSSVAVTMTSLGPAGSRTTIQKWLVVKDSSGNPFYIPCF